MLPEIVDHRVVLDIASALKMRTATETALLDAALAPGALVPAFQPIVDTLTGLVVGFEALARWPQLPQATPDRVFAAARLIDRVEELDWACRIAAVRQALAMDLGQQCALFLNAEPSTFSRAFPPEVADLIDQAQARLHIIVEITERALLTNTGDVLRMIQRLRARGWGIALDDVGAEPASLTMLPFVAPDVIKLDISLIQQAPTPEQSRIIGAVMAHSERSGAVILAEGVETMAHHDQAVAIGATLEQGWMVGRPGPLPSLIPTPNRLRLLTGHVAIPATPFEVVQHSRPLRIVRKRLLLALSEHIEQQSMNLHEAPVVLSVFQQASRFTELTQARYGAITARGCYVGVLGQGLSATPMPGVHGGHLDPLDPLCQEWTVIVVGDHYAGALIARDLGDTGPDWERRFEFTVTHNRDLVLSAARSLMARLLPYSV